MSFLCDYDNKNLYFFTFQDFSWYFSFCSFLLLSKFGNIVIQLKFDLLCMLSGPGEKIIFSTKFRMADESHVTLKSLNCFTDLFQGSNLPWPYAFWCDSEITFSRGLQIWWQYCISVLINVLCGAGGDASFAPQANLVSLNNNVAVSILHVVYNSDYVT